MIRALDVVVSSLSLLLLSLLFAIIAIAVRLSSPGPVFFTQERLGRHGDRFRMVKFRSMCFDAEQILQSNQDLSRQHLAHGFKLPTDLDPRMTGLGRFLRKWSLDELPQLVNVLKGEMSLVGPRPITPAEAEQYGESITVLLSVRPGLTGIWQVSGRSTVVGNARAQMELWYAATRSIWTDLTILARTPLAVLSRRGVF